MADHPSPQAAFLSAVDELRDTGHDLWSLGDTLWGWDFERRRPGAGLQLRTDFDDRGIPLEGPLEVTFDPDPRDEIMPGPRD